MAYLLAFGVERGGGLIQEEDSGVFDDRSGDGDTLSTCFGRIAWSMHGRRIGGGGGEGASYMWYDIICVLSK